MTGVERLKAWRRTPKPIEVSRSSLRPLTDSTIHCPRVCAIVDLTFGGHMIETRGLDDKIKHGAQEAAGKAREAVGVVVP